MAMEKALGRSGGLSWPTLVRNARQLLGTDSKQLLARAAVNELTKNGSDPSEVPSFVLGMRDAIQALL